MIDNNIEDNKDSIVENIDTSIDRKQEKLDRIKQQIREDKLKDKTAKKKPFKWPFSRKQAMNKSLKKPDTILVFVANLRRDLEGPLLCKIYGGNFFVIRNHVYRFNPDRVLTLMNKFKVGVVREGLREMIDLTGNYNNELCEDWTSKNPGAKVNIDDPVLIKALIQAKLAEKPQVQMGGKWWIIALVLVGLIAGFFLLTGKKKVAPVPTG